MKIKYLIFNIKKLKLIVKYKITLDTKLNFNQL